MADVDLWLAAANQAADVARAAIRPYFRSGLGAETKSDLSPVTRADRDAEQAIRATLRKHCPDHGIEGEEYGLERPDAALRWVVDPIDGTRAFITGRPTFGTLIALLRDGVPILGIIDQPMTGERWTGVAGRATVFRSALGGLAGCRACPAIGQAELSCTDPAMFAGTDLDRWTKLRDAARRISWGGDCYAYGLLALGQIDIIAEATMKIWDWAALVPVIEGAGGRMTDWDGAPLRRDGDGRVLAVGNPALLPEAIGLLR
jgi:myo-inositol-1(or 4)-monophosphatase